MSLNILNEVFSNNFHYDILTVLSLCSILCGILVITSKNPIVSVLFLIGLFLSIASYLMAAGINFIGLSYLLVYVGAVSILFLFILMLINVRISELLTDNNNSIPSAIIITIIFSLVLYRLLPYNFNPNTDADPNLPVDGNLIFTDDLGIWNLLNNFLFVDNKLLLVTSQVWDGMLAEMSHITTIGSIIYTVYPIWLILTSLILLLAMVGAILITLK